MKPLITVSLVVLSLCIGYSKPLLAQTGEVKNLQRVESEILIGQRPSSSISANPAPFFRPVLQQIENELPPGLIMRLPSSISYGSEVRPTVISFDNYLAVVFTIAGCFPPDSGSCSIGRIYVTEPTNDERRWLQENQAYGDAVSLGNGIQGFYSPGELAPRGYTPSILWQQDGLIYGVRLYAGESVDSTIRQRLIDIATSMANQSVAANPNTQRLILQEQGVFTSNTQRLPSDNSPYHIYTFSGNAGQTVQIDMQSSDFDTYLALLSPNGDVLAENDDSGRNSTNSSITYRLPRNGTYRVVANSYDSSGRGQYTITVQEQ